MTDKIDRGFDNATALVQNDDVLTPLSTRSEVPNFLTENDDNVI